MFNGIMSRMFETLTRILGNERGEVSIGGDNPLLEGSPVGEEGNETPVEPSVETLAGSELPEGEVPDETPTPDPRDEKIAALEASIEEIKAAQTPKGSEQPKETPSEQPKDLTPDQWVEAEKGWGFARNKNAETGEESLAIDPRKLLMRISASLDNAVLRAQQYTDKLVHGNVSDIRFDSVMGGMEKKPGFTDIRQYSEAVRGYMKDRYDPKDHSNPKFIEDGYYWAKGKNLKNAVKKAVDSTVRNKTIVKPAGAGSPPSTPKGKLTVAAMTAEQKNIAEQTFRNVPREKAWAEYCKLY
jgi:hypothetical protein